MGGECKQSKARGGCESGRQAGRGGGSSQPATPHTDGGTGKGGRGHKYPRCPLGKAETPKSERSHKLDSEWIPWRDEYEMRWFYFFFFFYASRGEGTGAFILSFLALLHALWTDEICVCANKPDLP